jgi:peptide/nickel transport system permease protein
MFYGFERGRGKYMGKVLTLIVQRLGLGLLTLFAVSLIIFLGVELLPGDIATEILGKDAQPETVEAFRKELGLDKPPVTRYFDWVGATLSGDFGNSFANGRPISDLIGFRLKNTLFLALMTASIAVPLSLIAGVAAALYRNSWYDRAINMFTLTSISFPEFFIAYILIIVFGQNLGWFPTLSNVNADMPFWQKLYLCALPALTMTLAVFAHMMRMTRAAILNLLASPYIEMANLKGLERSRIVTKHALPNAWAPIANVVALNMAYLVVSVVVVEVVFVFPGLGQLMVDSVIVRDVPVVQACSMIFAATYILLNLTADIVSIVTNPRLLHPR